MADDVTADVTADAGPASTPTQPASEKAGAPETVAEGSGSGQEGCAPVAFKRRPTVAELREKYPPTQANLAALALLEATEHLDNSDGRYPGGGGKPRSQISAKTVVQALERHGVGAGGTRTAKGVRRESSRHAGKTAAFPHTAAVREVSTDT